MGGAGLGFFFPSFLRFTVDFHPLGMESLAGMHSFVGILIGSGLLYWIGSVAGRTFGRDALGEGDIKLLGCVGAFCGWQGASLYFVFLVELFWGAFLLIPLLLWQKIIFPKQNDFENEPLDLVWRFFWTVSGIGCPGIFLWFIKWLIMVFVECSARFLKTSFGCNQALSAVIQLLWIWR